MNKTILLIIAFLPILSINQQAYPIQQDQLLQPELFQQDCIIHQTENTIKIDTMQILEDTQQLAFSPPCLGLLSDLINTEIGGEYKIKERIPYTHGEGYESYYRYVVIEKIN